MFDFVFQMKHIENLDDPRTKDDNNQHKKVRIKWNGKHSTRMCRWFISISWNSGQEGV